MKKLLLIFLFALAPLSGCAQKASPSPVPTLDATALNRTAVSLATEDIALTQTALPPTATGAWTPASTLDRTRPPIQTPTPQAPCNRASAGSPMDVTIPDGTVLRPGQTFSKTWRLENAGSCEWTRLYAVTFFSGNSLNAFQTEYIAQGVSPGEVIDITVDFEAPLKPGMYQSNWMLADPEGNLFGIGPNGDAPFWVRIEVVAAETPTHTPTGALVITPTVVQTGEVGLVDGDQLDLDAGEVNPETLAQADLVYQMGGDPAHILVTMNGTQWAVMDETQPTFSDCHQATLTGNAISFAEVPVGIFACYTTSEGQPGRLRIAGWSAGELSLTFLTWAQP